MFVLTGSSGAAVSCFSFKFDPIHEGLLRGDTCLKEYKREELTKILNVY